MNWRNLLKTILNLFFYVLLLTPIFCHANCSVTTINGNHRVVYQASNCVFAGPPYSLQMQATNSFSFDYPVTGFLYETGPSVLLDLTYNMSEVIVSGWIAYKLSWYGSIYMWVDIDRIFTDGFER